MKIAILGFGRQGKKHFSFWKRYSSLIDIFSLSGEAPSLAIHTFLPEAYDIIIVAISPIFQQEKVILKIINSEFRGYLIIEKPIVDDISLLSILVERKKTLFFIDEGYLPKENTVITEFINPTITIQSTFLDRKNVLEHAMGLLMPATEFSFFLSQVSISYKESNKIGYNVRISPLCQYSFDCGNLYRDGEKLPFTFDYCSYQLVKSLKNEHDTYQMRLHYYMLRTSKHFS